MFLLFILPFLPALSQNAPTADFNFTSGLLCLEGGLELDNLSENATRYEWDLCEGDFSDEYKEVYSSTISGAGRHLGIDFIKKNGLWYGIATSYNDNKLYRLTFGNGLSSTPTSVTDLGNVGGLLKQPVSIGLLEREGVVYALVHNWDSRSLVRVMFEDGISGSNQVSKLIRGSYGGLFSKMEIIATADELKTVLINQNATIEVIDFKNDINREISDVDVLKTAAVSGISGTHEIEVIQVKDSWYAFVASFNNGNIGRIDFGADIMTGIKNVEPVVTSNLYGGGNPNNIEIVKSGSGYELHVVNFQGALYKVNLGLDIRVSNINAGSVQYGAGATYDQGFAMHFVRDKGEWYNFLVRDMGAILYSFKSDTPCYASVDYSEEENPQLFYSKTGIYPITLTAYHENGTASSVTKNVAVTENQAPQLLIYQAENNCLSNPITVTTENLTPDQTITSHTWTFPDGSQQYTEEASYQFAAAGTYTVRLDVESENGCGNFFFKEVTVYPEPQAAYTVSEAKVCSNATIAFTNTTDFEADSVISYNWDFGDGTTSAESSPQHEFAEPGAYTVILSVSIPGCTSASTQTIEVQEGPKALFEASAVCQEATLTFGNRTSGESITGYTWDLGDGTYSTLENPEHIYEAPGTYLVMLQAKNELGCETSFTKSVRVYSLPQPDFKNTPACEGNRVQFTDATLDMDGNIIAWNWTFEMPDGTTLNSNEQHPEVTFTQAGSFEVSLTTTTTWNCQQTVKKPVEVDQMPQVEIGFDGVCVGDSAILADVTNTGDLGVQSWYWMVGSEVYTDSAFSFHFAQAGTYELFLQLNLENGCSVQGTKQITVEPLPAVDFAFSGACVGQVATFEALTPSTEYSWTIEGKPVGSEGPVIQYTFNEEGTYRVVLTVFDEQGCSNSLSKEIAVGQPPVAAFSPDRLQGVAPFKVHFSNHSEGAIAYRWLFDDKQQSSSSLENPAFTFTEIGNYTVQLVSYNKAGCADTIKHQLSVLNPSYDVALTSLHKISEGKRMQLVLGLENKGTIRVSGMEVEVILNNEYLVREQFTDTLEIGEQRNYSLRMVLDEQGRRKLDFVCVRLKPKLTLVSEELSVLNNEMCLNFNQAFIMQAPHPNPGSDEVMLSFVLPGAGGSVAVEVYTTQGNLVQKGELKNMKPGFNQQALDIRALGKGMYYIRCRYGAEHHSYRIVKN